MKINLIYAFKRTKYDQLIGIGNGLPWKCLKDMEFYKKMTRNKTLLMGINTYKSIYGDNRNALS